MLDVGAVLQGEHGDRLVPRVGDPVFGNARRRVIDAFLHQVAVRIVRADHFRHQVRAQPVAVLIAAVRAVAEQQQVGLAKRTRADAHAQRGDHHDAAARLEVGSEQVIEEQQHGLVGGGGHRQFLDAAVGDFDEAVALVGEPQVGGFVPRALGWQNLAQQRVQRLLRGRRRGPGGPGGCGGTLHSDCRYDMRPPGLPQDSLPEHALSWRNTQSKVVSQCRESWPF